MQQPEPPKSSHSRPSLLSPSDVGDSGHARILGSVPGTSAATPKPTKKRMGLLLLGLGLVAATWGLLSRPGQTSSDAAPLAASTPAAPATPPLAAASETVAVADTTPTPPAAATITDAPMAASPAPTASKDDANALSTMLEAGVAVPPDTLKSALSAKPAAHPPAKPKPAVARTEPAKAIPENGKPSTPAAKAVSSDNDVDLISALMAHSGGQSEPKSTPRTKKPTANAGSPDIVERHGGDSTATLLKRCKRLGGTEAKLCSRRICTGHESEAACKAK